TCRVARCWRMPQADTSKGPEKTGRYGDGANRDRTGDLLLAKRQPAGGGRVGGLAITNFSCRPATLAKTPEKTEGEGFEPSSEENPLKRFSRPFPARRRRGRIWLHHADFGRTLRPATGPGERLGERNRSENVTCVDGRRR